MDVGVLTSLISAGTAIVSSFIGWLIGRRKNKADSSLIESDVLNKVRDFYKASLDDTNNKLKERIKSEHQKDLIIKKYQEQDALQTQLIYEIIGSVTMSEEYKRSVLDRMKTMNVNLASSDFRNSD